MFWGCVVVLVASLEVLPLALSLSSRVQSRMGSRVNT